MIAILDANPRSNMGKYFTLGKDVLVQVPISNCHFKHSYASNRI